MTRTDAYEPFSPEHPDWVEWVADCEQYRGAVLTGRYAHWCDAWDGLPMDETCGEFPCDCAFMDAMTAWEWQQFARVRQGLD